MAWTTAMLSEEQVMRQQDQRPPQMAAASTMGRSSLTAMLVAAQQAGHLALNQPDEQTAPKPQLPEASVNNCRWGKDGEMNRLEPFHSSAKESHHRISALADALRRM